jgi:hypothetical protein
MELPPWPERVILKQRRATDLSGHSITSFGEELELLGHIEAERPGSK